MAIRKTKTWETYLKAQARRIWGWTAERKKAQARALVGINKDGVRMFLCEVCDAAPLPRESVEIDHVESVENVGVWDGWDAWLARLFVHAEGLKVTCKPCHKAKTTKQSAERRAARKASK
jgi:hypothetical protein